MITEAEKLHLALSLQQTCEALKKENAALKAALLGLNSAIDAMWNDHGSHLPPERHMKAICAAQVRCKEALTSSEGAGATPKHDYEFTHQGWCATCGKPEADPIHSPTSAAEDREDEKT